MAAVGLGVLDIAGARENVPAAEGTTSFFLLPRQDSTGMALTLATSSRMVSRRVV
ncbi:hypothetical protein [Streptomyces sp. CB02488]|uniref:hypothetical protein n=1 Tax=Streptomyces sp. CB02488 TaxID=1703920 RepID=UPI000A8B4D22|nr:hypothetical protein [Streptomyces sp. CB02488]